MASFYVTSSLVPSLNICRLAFGAPPLSQAQQLFANLVKIIRNVDRKFTFHPDMTTQLEALVKLCYHIDLPVQREVLERMRFRGVELRGDGVADRHVLQLFTDWIPHGKKSGIEKQRELDRKYVQQMVKSQGGGSKLAVAAALQQSLLGGGLSVAPQPFYSSTPAPLFAPLATQSVGSLTLPLSSAQGAASASVQPAKRSKSKASSGGKASAVGGGQSSVRVPSAQAAQARADFNARIQQHQQSQQPHPMGYHCDDCATNKRNPHHRRSECAYEECHKCRRGGHRKNACPFPKYP